MGKLCLMIQRRYIFERSCRNIHTVMIMGIRPLLLFSETYELCELA